MAASHEIDYVEVSAKSGINVEAMFKSLSAKILEKKGIAVGEDITTNVVPLTRNTSKTECCNIF